jgi:hypothetical protein
MERMMEVLGRVHSNASSTSVARKPEVVSFGEIYLREIPKFCSKSHLLFDSFTFVSTIPQKRFPFMKLPGSKMQSHQPERRTMLEDISGETRIT